MDRGTDYPIDTISRGRLDRKLATPSFEECNELIRARSYGWHLISQPLFELLGVGNRCLPEASQGSDFGATPFCGPPRQDQRIITGNLNAQWPCNILNDRPVGLGGRSREPSTVTEERQQHGEAQLVGVALGHDERSIRRRQDPSFQRTRFIDNFHLGCSISRRGAAAPPTFYKICVL
jgi:hypothetical protein